MNIKFSVGASTLAVGDALSPAGHAQTYVVTVGVTLGTTGVVASGSSSL